jgi:hypothetical protein
MSVIIHPVRRDTATLLAGRRRLLEHGGAFNPADALRGVGVPLGVVASRW